MPLGQQVHHQWPRKYFFRWIENNFHTLNNQICYSWPIFASASCWFNSHIYCMLSIWASFIASISRLHWTERRVVCALQEVTVHQLPLRLFHVPLAPSATALVWADLKIVSAVHQGNITWHLKTHTGFNTLCFSPCKVVLSWFQQHLPVRLLRSWILLHWRFSFSYSAWSRAGSLRTRRSSQARALSSWNFPASMNKNRRCADADLIDLPCLGLFSLIPQSAEVHNPASSVKEVNCATRQAYPCHRSAQKDLTVLQNLLFLTPVLQSVEYIMCTVNI